MVAIPSLFLNLTEVTDLTSIGTLFAFVLVSGGVLILHPRGVKPDKGLTPRFYVPYFNSRYWLPPVLLLAVALYFYLYKVSLTESASSVWTDRIPYLVFGLISLIISILAVIRQWSLIPVLGLLTNLYLMSELGFTNWMRFLVWLVIGLIIYIAYGYRKSRLKEWLSVKSSNDRI